MKTILIDADEVQRDNLRITLSRYTPNAEISGVSDSALHGRLLINAIKPDLVFISTKLQDEDGFDLLDGIEDRNFDVVFLADNENQAAKAFRYQALDYLIRPIETLHVVSAVERCFRKRQTSAESSRKLIKTVSVMASKIPLPYQNGVKYIELSKNVRLEADGSYTTIHIDGAKPQVVSKPLRFYTDMLSGELFLKLHRSHVVNASFVKEYSREGGGCIVLQNGERIHISERKKDSVLRRLSSY